MSQSGQPMRIQEWQATNGADEGNPNAERPIGRKAEKATRKHGDSDSDPFIEELKHERGSTTQRKNINNVMTCCLI
jgi:hypothetical protein